MVQRLVRAAKSVVRSATGGLINKRVSERRLLLVLDRHKKGLYVLDAVNPELFLLAKHERAMAKAISVLSANGGGPWPFFDRLNVVPVKNSRRQTDSFVERHIEYDVLCIAQCGQLFQAKGLTPVQALEQCGIRLIPIKNHPFKEDIKRVLQLA